jgi:hypothetical protein
MTEKKPAGPWTAPENLGVCRLYFAMLDRATAGAKYNKAAMIREATRDNGAGDTGPLVARSRGSVELKLMNASAAHAIIRPQAVTMDGFGYRAMANMQRGLLDAMRAEIERREKIAADWTEASA